MKEDWLAENSDAREEGVTRWQLENQIGHAKRLAQEDPEDMDRQYDLAHAYGVLDPCDKRCLNVCERMMANGVRELDVQRQGEAYQLHGRSLFLAGRHEEALAALQRAKICFTEKGNFKLRRQNNAGLLRVYSALGKGKEASERLEVALTLCEAQDDCITLYISAKQALEHTGKDRDREVLDDIWYVFLDTHEEEKKKWEEYEAMGTGLCRQFAGGEERQEEAAVTWGEIWQRLKDPEVWRDILPQAVADAKKSPLVRGLFTFTACLMATYILLTLVLAAKGQSA